MFENSKANWTKFRKLCVEKYQLVAEHDFTKSIKEVVYITIISFLPLFLSILINSVAVDSFIASFHQRVSPLELLAFSLSFMSPVILFIMTRFFGKDQVSIPFGSFFFLCAISLYVLSSYFVITFKNGSDEHLKGEFSKEAYVKITSFILLMVILFRLYSVYHTKRNTSYVALQKAAKAEQDKKNREFLNKLGE